MSRKTKHAKEWRRQCILLSAKRDRHERRKKRKRTVVSSDIIMGDKDWEPNLKAMFRPRACVRRKEHRG